MFPLLHLAAAWAAPPQVVEVIRDDHVVAGDLGVSTSEPDTVFHLVLPDHGQAIDVLCRTSTPPGPTCTMDLPGGRKRTLRVASLSADAAERFVMQPAVWIGEARMVGKLAAADLGQALALVDLAAGQGWTATALVGQSVGDAEGQPLFPPDEASKGGAREVGATVLASWRCAALDSGSLTGPLQTAPASALPWLTRAAGWCDAATMERLRAPLCDAWRGAPETDPWCGRSADTGEGPEPAESAPRTGTGVAGGVVGGVTTKMRSVHPSEIWWKQQTAVEVPSGEALTPGETIRCNTALELDGAGTPTKVVASQCPLPYAAATEAAVRTWRAYPTKMDGEAIYVRSTIIVSFTAP